MHQRVFQDALHGSLVELQPTCSSAVIEFERSTGEVDLLFPDPVFSGARGAAEMAKRAMEATPGGGGVWRV